MKILILKPSSLGDIVQALPVLRLIKAHQPAHQVYWWVSADLAELLEGDPDLAGLFLFQRRRWARPWHWGELVKSVRQIRSEQFDLVMDLQGLARSGLICWLARPRLAIGIEDSREGAATLYDRRVPRPSATTHAVDWYLTVLRELGVPVHNQFEWLPPRLACARDLRAKWDVGKARWIIINPGARWLNKRWPVEYFVQVVCDLAKDYPGYSFAVMGGRDEANLAQQISQAAKVRCLDLSGRTSLSEMIEWIRLSSLVITNDTGPMHVAAALRKPIVALFGPTNPQRTGPYGQLERVLRVALPCSPCLRPRCHNPRPLECLTALTPARACAQAKLLLGNPGSI